MATAKKSNASKTMDTHMVINTNKFRPDLPLNERIDLLSKKATKIEHEEYIRPLDPDEIDQAKIKLADNVLDLQGKRDELKEIQAEKQVAINALKEHIENLSASINSEEFNGVGDLFYIPNEDQKLFYVYNAGGNFVRTEKLTVFPMFNSQGDAYNPVADLTDLPPVEDNQESFL